MNTFLPPDCRYIKRYNKRYTIYRDGTIISNERKVWNGRIWWVQTEKELKKHISTRGYYQISLTKNCKTQIYQLHRLLAEVFISNLKKKPFINHIDGNKQNNHHTNLEWVTRKENDNHARRTGLNNGLNGAKLNEGQVKAIRVEYPLVAIECIAKQYSVSQYTIRNVVKYKTWRHIK